ncbi:MAG: hypothetical protein AAGA76_07190 [Pseudomonadota bacterium]
MADKTSSRPFFVGYGSKLPKDIAKLILPVFALFITTFVALSLLLSSSAEEAGDGRFRFDLGRQTLAGVLQYHPYPVLRLPAEDGNPAKTLMMSGGGKRGAFVNAQGMDGEAVVAWGVYMRRGDITMLQVAGRQNIEASEEELPEGFQPSKPVSLGKWRLAGEICDGKCYTGAMRPGTGLAHKACANLCVAGGIPPVFVSSGDVDGSSFFLLTDKDGKPVGDQIRDLMALYVEAEGEVERLDDLTVFKMDLATVKVLP